MVKKENEKQTEEIIFEAAMEVFEEKGFDAARMQDIADRAGINKALLHYYFRSKEQLFEHVFDKKLDQMFMKIIGVFISDEPFEEKIRLYYKEHIDFFQKNPGLPIFVMSEIAHNPERLKKRFSNIDFYKVRDVAMKMHAKEMEEYGIGIEDWEQLIITIVSLTVFPFMAQEIIKTFLSQEKNKQSFTSFMDERKDFAADFVISALKNLKRK